MKGDNIPSALHVSIPRSFLQYYTPFILENRPTIHSLEDKDPSWGTNAVVYSISFYLALKGHLCLVGQLESSYRRSDLMSLEGGRRLKLDPQAVWK